MARINLTIDNGPHPANTPRVLDVLAAHAVPATFFVVGTEAAKPGGLDLLEQIATAGHRIGNHTWNHRVPFGLNDSATAIADEVVRTSDLLAPFLGSPPLFRPFGGGGNLDSSLLSAALIEYLCENGYTCVLWNLVPRDWEDPTGWVDRALADIQENDETVLVVHDFVAGAATQIDRFIREAQAVGHTFTIEPAADCLPVVAGKIQFDLSRYTGR